MNWVVFDFGEVIVQRTEALPELATRFGASLGDFEPVYWKYRDDFDAGGSDLEYWCAIGAELGTEVDDTRSAELTALDIEGWSRTDPETLALLAELDEAGVPLALLSNASSSMGRWVEEQEWARHFRHLIFSGDLGVLKPDPAIFAALLDRLGAPGEECLFFDDRQTNVDGAIAAGLHAERWIGSAGARSQLGWKSAAGPLPFS
ncbi:HAD family phosphatase [Saccharothrix sp. AJ9571]|nr:HAD family phosphatase [Saccharothrix sp. AJ9571]